MGEGAPEALRRRVLRAGDLDAAGGRPVALASDERRVTISRLAGGLSKALAAFAALVLLIAGGLMAWAWAPDQPTDALMARWGEEAAEPVDD